MTMNENTNKLAKLLTDNNILAFRQLYEQFYKKLCFYIYEIILDFEASKDVAQDIFSKLWQDRATLPNFTDFEHYLFKIARNSAFDYIRKNITKSKYESYISFISNEAYKQEDTLEFEELQTIFKMEVDAFSDKTKEIFYLKNEKNKTIKEISKMLSLPVKTVEWHSSKIKKTIRKIIKDYMKS
jgi:RNA polymerase sigma-70 factor (ECF subfamily)